MTTTPAATSLGARVGRPRFLFARQLRTSGLSDGVLTEASLPRIPCTTAMSTLEKYLSLRLRKLSLTLSGVEATLRAIAAPHRRQILTLVRDDELSAGEIAAHFDVTRPAISQHLNVLKEAGLLSERRNGTKRLYRARPEGLAEVKVFLEGFWDARLGALKREAENEEVRKHGRDN